MCDSAFKHFRVQFSYIFCSFLIADPELPGEIPIFDEEDIMPSMNVGGRDSEYTTQFLSNPIVQLTPSLTADIWRDMLSDGGKSAILSCAAYYSTMRNPFDTIIVFSHSFRSRSHAILLCWLLNEKYPDPVRSVHAVTPRRIDSESSSGSFSHSYARLVRIYGFIFTLIGFQFLIYVYSYGHHFLSDGSFCLLDRRYESNIADVILFIFIVDVIVVCFKCVKFKFVHIKFSSHMHALLNIKSRFISLI